VDPAKSIYVSQRQRGWHLDAANQDASQRSHFIEDTVEPSNNNNNNNPICKVPECQKTSVALADRNSRAN